MIDISRIFDEVAIANKNSVFRLVDGFPSNKSMFCSSILVETSIWKEKETQVQFDDGQIPRLFNDIAAWLVDRMLRNNEHVKVDW